MWFFVIIETCFLSSFFKKACSHVNKNVFIDKGLRRASSFKTPDYYDFFLLTYLCVTCVSVYYNQPVTELITAPVWLSAMNFFL